MVKRLDFAPQARRYNCSALLGLESGEGGGALPLDSESGPRNCGGTGLAGEHLPTTERMASN
jgi:hypothetical protein